MNETQVKHFIVMERQKGTTIEELIFILHDNGVPEYEISNYLEISIKYVEEILYRNRKPNTTCSQHARPATRGSPWSPRTHSVFFRNWVIC